VLQASINGNLKQTKSVKVYSSYGRPRYQGFRRSSRNRVRKEVTNEKIINKPSVINEEIRDIFSQYNNQKIFLKNER
jgi:hypothetical protein